MAAEKITARGAYLKLTAGPAGASTLTLSGQSNQMTLSQPQDAPEITVFGTTNKQRMFDGIKDWELTFDGYWDGAASNTDDFFFAAFSGSCLIELGPGGSTAGCPKYMAVGVIQDYTISFELENAITLSGTIVAKTGSMTQTTF